MSGEERSGEEGGNREREGRGARRGDTEILFTVVDDFFRLGSYS